MTPHELYDALVALRNAVLAMHERIDAIEEAMHGIACGQCDRPIPTCTCCAECGATPCACRKPALHVLPGGLR